MFFLLKQIKCIFIHKRINKDKKKYLLIYKKLNFTKKKTFNHRNIVVETAI